MSVLADFEIAMRCGPYTHTGIGFDDASKIIEGITHSKEEVERMVRGMSAFPIQSEESRWPARRMIEPFSPTLMREEGNRKVISYGLSSYGYDARLARDVKVFTNVNSAIIDPRKIDERCMTDVDIRVDADGAEYVLIPPNGFMLGHTVEYFRIPNDVLVICLGKSTYARCGIIVNVTPLEPGWEGNVVLEFSNTTSLPAKIYLNQGVCQFIFNQALKRCKITYADRGGKYQGQTGITHAKV